MLRTMIGVLCVLAFLAGKGIADAADADNGKSLARTGCRCHRPGELEKLGQEKLFDLLLQYKSGEIQHRVMSRQADRYSKDQLADIAAYYGSK